MNDEKTNLTVLADAFTELERRADRVTAEVAYVPPAAAHRRRWPVVAAAAAGVAVVATGAALLAQPDGHPSRPVAGGHSSGRTVAAHSPETPTAGGHELVPSSPAEIARRFRAVLDDTVGGTFTVTDTGHAVTVTLPPPAGATGNVRVPNGGTPNGAAIVGRLTVAGVPGGYDVQMLDAHGAKASCDSPARCSTKVFADGATLAVGQDELEGGGVTYVADFVRADGTEVLMHVSNRKDPKGAGAILAAQPPLTKAQLRTIVTSNLW